MPGGGNPKTKYSSLQFAYNQELLMNENCNIHNVHHQPSRTSSVPLRWTFILKETTKNRNNGRRSVYRRAAKAVGGRKGDGLTRLRQLWVDALAATVGPMIAPLSGTERMQFSFHASKRYSQFVRWGPSGDYFNVWGSLSTYYSNESIHLLESGPLQSWASGPLQISVT